jgi:hypothetical protein
MHGKGSEEPLVCLAMPESLPSESVTLATWNERGVATASIVLVASLGLFVVVIGYLVVASMMPRNALVFEPTPIAPTASVESLVHGTVTVYSRDETLWHFFDFDRRSPILPPDTAGWDLAIRRFSVIAADAVVDVGKIGFDDVVEVPHGGFVHTSFGRDTVNAAIDRWYRYSMLSHLLKPNGHVYVVRTRESRFAKLEFLSYYCPGVVAGCLTFRYQYQPNNARSFSR